MAEAPIIREPSKGSAATLQSSFSPEKARFPSALLAPFCSAPLVSSYSALDTCLGGSAEFGRCDLHANLPAGCGRDRPAA